MKGKGTEEDKGTMWQCSLHYFPLQESGGVGLLSFLFTNGESGKAGELMAF